MIFFFLQQQTTYELRISDWSSVVCSSALGRQGATRHCDLKRRLSVHGLTHRAIAARRDKKRGCAPAIIEATASFGPPCYKRPETVIGDGLVIHGKAQIADIWIISPVRNGEALACELRSEEHTSELQSLMRISYAVFCLKKKNNNKQEKTY